MANIAPRATVEVRARMDFSENELRALEALTGYGIHSFLEVFYTKLGKAYMQPHEAGLRELFASVNAHVPPILRRADAAREAFGEKKS
ncbi:hypothetical protein [Burkholderia sp. IMCC1007]|uniref:hypothetical protein n=1 Tax=Burkholderia sp. IMCC1007 TaxID=3004104 RepID=UPI0022B3349F|nr:hypothetical protein [Burkholderia sp. IMCC1007]